MSDILDKPVPEKTAADAVDRALKRTVHMSTETIGVTLAVGVVVMVYGGFWASGGQLALGGCEGLVSLVHHAVSSIVVNLLTIDALLTALAMFFSRSLFAGLLYNYVSKPILRLFVHSCAFSLGVGLGYLVLMWPEITPRSELASVVRFCVAVTFGATFVTGVYFVMELVQLQDLEKGASEILKRLSSNLAADDDSLLRMSGLTVSVLGCIAAVVLATSAWQQLPTDFRFMHRADNQSVENMKCAH